MAPPLNSSVGFPPLASPLNARLVLKIVPVAKLEPTLTRPPLLPVEFALTLLRDLAVSSRSSSLEGPAEMLAPAAILASTLALAWLFADAPCTETRPPPEPSAVLLT